MDILHSCPSLSFSGLEQYALAMAVDQKRRGFNVAMVVYPGSEIEVQAQKAGLETIPFSTLKPGDWLPFIFRMNSWLGKHPELKVLHMHLTQDLGYFSWVFILRKILGSKKFKTILQSHIWVNHRKKDLYHKALYSLIDELWCSSTPAREKILELFPVAPEKVRIIEYGRDVALMEPQILDRTAALKELGLQDKGLMIGCVNRIEEGKGIREYLEGGLAFLKKHIDAQLVLIGGPSAGDPKAEKFYAETVRWLKGLGDPDAKRIHLLGAVKNSFQYLKAFDLYVVPSYQETFSLALLDAQLAGLPVLGTNTGGTPEVVRPEETGWLFEPRSVDAVAQALDQALRDRSKWQGFGERARARVRQDFDQLMVFKKVIQNYGLEK